MTQIHELKLVDLSVVFDEPRENLAFEQRTLRMMKRAVRAKRCLRKSALKGGLTAVSDVGHPGVRAYSAYSDKQVVDKITRNWDHDFQGQDGDRAS